MQKTIELPLFPYVSFRPDIQPVQPADKANFRKGHYDPEANLLFFINANGEGFINALGQRIAVVSSVQIWH